MNIRCKFVCESVTEHGQGKGSASLFSAKLRPVYSNQDPNHERSQRAMTVKAIEDTLAVVKAAAVALIKARQAGTPVLQAVQAPEFVAAVTAAVPELGQVAGEALNLSLVDDLELGRYLFSTVTDIVKAVRAVRASAVSAPSPQAA